MAKRKILTIQMASALRVQAKDLYAASGPAAVYEMGNEKGLPYSHCSQCNAETPTIEEVVASECLLCGGSK